MRSTRFRHGAAGTRFRIYAQAPALAAYRDPVTVELSPPPGSLGPGPSDERMCVIEPVGKPTSYGELLLAGRRGPDVLPPWRGPVLAPACAGPDGHFDRIDPADPAFAMAHAYACVRLTLDVWERHAGPCPPWHFARHQSWLEVGLVPTYDNAESGYGWLELGADLGPDRSQQLYATNIDVVAHEVGHLLVHSVVGLAADTTPEEFAGFHEAAADFTALLVSASLDPVLEEVLARTRGNLYVANELNRLGELTSSTQIRVSSNGTKMSEFALGWSNEHDLSEPITGALFDLLLDLYQERLIEHGLIPPALAADVEELGRLRAFAPMIQAEFDRLYPRDPAGFRDALVEARDLVGCCFARALELLDVRRFRYRDLEPALARADRALTGGRLRRAIAENFAWREIGRVDPGPYLGGPRGTNALTFGLHRCAKRSALGG